MEISNIADYITIISALRYVYSRIKKKSENIENILKTCLDRIKPRKSVILSNEELFNYSPAVIRHNYMTSVDPDFRKFCLKSWWVERNSSAMRR